MKTDKETMLTELRSMGEVAFKMKIHGLAEQIVAIAGQLKDSREDKFEEGASYLDIASLKLELMDWHMTIGIETEFDPAYPVFILRQVANKRGVTVHKISYPMWEKIYSRLVEEDRHIFSMLRFVNFIQRDIYNYQSGLETIMDLGLDPANPQIW